jgi:hypothetical protein
LRGGKDEHKKKQTNKNFLHTNLPQPLAPGERKTTRRGRGE